MAGVGQGFQQGVITPGSAADFRWTGVLARDASRALLADPIELPILW